MMHNGHLFFFLFSKCHIPYLILLNIKIVQLHNKCSEISKKIIDVNLYG